jgi:hypothetical protein
MQPAISLIFAVLLFAKLGRNARLALGVLAVAGHIYRAIGLGESAVRNGIQPKKQGQA